VAIDHDDEDAGWIAHLIPCGHNLHNNCLKPWVERANSCPICRQSFNVVELTGTIGGEWSIACAVVHEKSVCGIELMLIPSPLGRPGIILLCRTRQSPGRGYRSIDDHR
jgi:hypothetical protein